MNQNWPQQSAFRQTLTEFARREGLVTKRGAVDYARLGDLVDVSEESLRQFMQHRSRKRPHIDTLSRIASLVGVSVTLFIDLPSDPPSFAPQRQWAGLNEQERAMASALLAEIASDTMTVGEKQELYTIFCEEKLRILRLRQQWLEHRRD
jgi:transcriptional regulator with XRE-family HTH domain